MQNEIELKIMLEEPNITPIQGWLSQQKVLAQETILLGNTYYDTPNQFFASKQMGFRVRTKNHQYEMTLKTKGDIIGGLHIRPEYNLTLTSPESDFKRLVSHFNLQIENAEQIHAQLQPTFSTDFTRQKWLIHHNQSQIEVVLDQGEVRNPFGQEPICELEFELLSGNLADIFGLITQMPKLNGMWLSGLSKAQRGYIVGKPERFKAEILAISSNKADYSLEQQFADYLRQYQDDEICELFYKKFPDFPKKNNRELTEYLKSREYLEKSLNFISA